MVLDQLALDDALPDAHSALERHVANLLLDSDLIQRTRGACLSALVAPDRGTPGALERLVQHEFPAGLPRALRHRVVQVILAAGKVIDDLRGEADCEYLALRLPRELVEVVGDAVAGLQSCQGRLRELLDGPPWSHPMSASILHAAGARWMPPAHGKIVLRGAYLERVAWRRAQFAGADFAEADLTAANLREADLSKANLRAAVLTQAHLRGARLRDVQAIGADLAGADLAETRAHRALFDNANLEGANFEVAVLCDASFTGANLTRAVFRDAELDRANFAEADLKEADFTGADLEGALLSGLRLRDAAWEGASFGAAQLVECDLEGMDLPRACFEDANLEGAAYRLPHAAGQL